MSSGQQGIKDTMSSRIRTVVFLAGIIIFLIASVGSSVNECVASSSAEMEKAVNIMRMLTGHEGTCTDLDVDGSGKVGSIDAVLALQQAASGSALEIKELTPANGTTNYPTDISFAVTFNHNIVVTSSGNINIKKKSDSSVVETFTAGSEHILVVDNHLFFRPSSVLDNYQDYYIEIEGEIVKGENGQVFSGITGNEIWSFKTAAQAYSNTEIKDEQSSQQMVEKALQSNTMNTLKNYLEGLSYIYQEKLVVFYTDPYMEDCAVVLMHYAVPFGSDLPEADLIYVYTPILGYAYIFNGEKFIYIGSDGIRHEDPYIQKNQTMNDTIVIDSNVLQKKSIAKHYSENKEVFLSDESFSGCTDCLSGCNPYLTECTLNLIQGEIEDVIFNKINAMSPRPLVGNITKIKIDIEEGDYQLALPESDSSWEEWVIWGMEWSSVAVKVTGIDMIPYVKAASIGYDMGKCLGKNPDAVKCYNKCFSGECDDWWDDLWSHGDPHLCAIDGLHFDFQGVGEYLYMQSIIDPNEMTIQVRQVPAGNSKHIAVNKAVAVSISGDQVELYKDMAKYSSSLFINGKPENISLVGLWHLPNGGKMYIDNDYCTLIWPDYSQIRINLGGSRIDMQGYFSAARKGNLRGLLGNYDGDKTNDLQTRDGSTIFDITTKLTKDELYNQFGNSWRITQEESLFTYAEGEDTATYTDLNFPYELVKTSDLSETVRANAEQTCRNAGVTDPILLEDCILDVGMTGDATFADNMTDLTPPEQSITVTDGWLLYGDAQKTEGDKIIHITPDESWQTGMALREGALNLDGSFEKTFTIYMGDSDYGADGMIFIMLPELPPEGTRLSKGGDLGFNSACNGKPCFGVEIDTYSNSSDPSQDHIALIRNSQVNHSRTENEALPVVPLTFNIEDDATHSLTVGWNKDTQTFSVSLDGNTLITHEGLDLKTLLGTSTASYGFVGATGTMTSEQYFYPVISF